MANNDTRLKDSILSVAGGRSTPVMQITREDSGTAAMISKLVQGYIPAEYDNKGQRKVKEPDFGAFKVASDRVAQNSADNQTVVQLLPDQALAKEILVSSIISPKDMTSNELNWVPPDGMFPPEITAALLTRLRSHFDNVYKIKTFLPKILGDALFMTGSYPIAVIPENAVDDMINGNRTITMESLSSLRNSAGELSLPNLGLLGGGLGTTSVAGKESKRFAFESLSINTEKVTPDVKLSFHFEQADLKENIDDLISVTDNIDVLKIPELSQKIRESRITEKVASRAMAKIGIGLEAIDAFAGRTTMGSSASRIKKLTDREIAALVYKERKFGYQPMAILKTQDQLARRTVGNPLIMHLPSESVIPVFVPGSMEKHVGFFLLLDKMGNPIRREDDADYYQQLSTRLNSNSNFGSAMIAKVKRQMEGFDLNNMRHLDYSAHVFGEMIERELSHRLRNGGIYSDGFVISKRQDTYMIMLARTLQMQHTQMVFVPVELMTYFAFKYNSDGTGRSLLDDLKLINSLRVMLMFSNIMASIRNSIGRTLVKMKIDEKDPDPQKTVEIMIHEIMRSKGQSFPLGTNNPADLVTFLQKAGYEFQFEGHPGLPDLTVDYEEKNSNYTKPDTELETDMRNRSIMGTHVPVEAVDAAQHPEFATAVVTNNILFSKRVMMYQDMAAPLLTDHIRKVVLNSEHLLDDLLTIVHDSIDKINLEENELTENPREFTDEEKKEGKRAIVEYYLQQFLLGLEVQFPRPDTVTLENQKAALQAYIEILDLGLNAYFSSEFVTTDMAGEAASHVDAVKSIVRAQFLRQWMADNNVLPELARLTSQNSDGKPDFDIEGFTKDHLEGVMKSIGQLIKRMKTPREKSDKLIQDAGAPEGQAAAPAEDTTDTGGGEPDDGLGDLFGDDTGSGDTGGEGEAGGETTPGEDEEKTPEEETQTPPEAPTTGSGNPETGLT